MRKRKEKRTKAGLNLVGMLLGAYLECEVRVYTQEKAEIKERNKRKKEKKERKERKERRKEDKALSSPETHGRNRR